MSTHATVFPMQHFAGVELIIDPFASDGGPWRNPLRVDSFIVNPKEWAEIKRRLAEIHAKSKEE